MKKIDPRAVLDLSLGDNDADAKTVRAYFQALLSTLWEEGEGFSGKRPFGNSGWDYDLYKPLVSAGIVPGKIGEDGDLLDFDAKAANAVIFAAIAALQ